MDNKLLFSLLVFFLLEFLLLLLYFPRLKAWFGSYKKQKRLINPKKNRIAVLIPARDESRVIESLFKDLKNQTYSSSLFDVYVIVKERNDKTIEISKKYNYHVHLAPFQTKKGEALDSCLKEILNKEKNYDSYLIIDADTGLDKFFIEEMNNAMLSKAKIISGCKVVKNYRQNQAVPSWQAICNGFIWTLIDKMGNRYKADHNYNIFPVGTGILLSKDIIEENGGWIYDKTLTEDCELMNDAVVRGWSTFYYEYALLYMEEAPTLEMTNKRRNRWFSGLIDAERIYYKQVKSIERNKHDRQNVFLLHSLNIIYLYFALAFLYFIVNFSFYLFSFLTSSSIYLSYLILSLSSFSLIYLSFFIMSAAVLLVEEKNIRLTPLHKLFILFTAPFYYMTYYKIIFKAFFFLSSKEWVPIERQSQEG